MDLLGEEKLEGFVLRTLSVLDTKVRREYVIRWILIG